MNHKNTKTSVTAKDVALLAGVSQSTVSRVLSSTADNGYISHKTAEKVRAAAAQLNYSPNPIARALRGERTNLLGLLVREIADPFFAEFISVLSSQAKANNYSVVLSAVHSDPTEALSITRVFDERQVDGVILLGDLRNDLTFLQQLLKNNRPVVALCRGRINAPIPTINCDNEAGIDMLLDHLYSLGHRRFAFLDGGWLGDIRERRDAFMNYFPKRNLKLATSLIQAESNSFQGGFDAMHSLLSLSPHPTAVLVSDDQMAMGAMRSALEAGLRIPQDVTITGFDGIEMAMYTYPALTTVRQPIEEMGRRTIQTVLNQIDGKQIPADEMFVEIKPELILRESTGPAPQN
jgi:DNA-binding LacI/PurR family transcriptional regulator